MLRSQVLTWSHDLSGIDGFKIEKSTDGSTYSEIASVGLVLTYTATNLLSNITYYFKVRAFSGATYSDYSTPVSLACDWGGQPGGGGVSGGSNGQGIQISTVRASIKRGSASTWITP